MNDPTTTDLKQTIDRCAHLLAEYHGITVRITYVVKPSPFDTLMTPLEVGS